MSTSFAIADKLRITRGTPAAEEPVSTLSRALIGADNEVVIDAQLLAAGDATQKAALQSLLEIMPRQSLAEILATALITPAPDDSYVIQVGATISTVSGIVTHIQNPA